MTENQWQSDIISACAQNNRKAQKSLYERYHGPMLGICMRYSNHREDAVEILNMGFFKVFKSIGKFKNTGSFEGWMRRIMVNTAIDYYRKFKKKEKDHYKVEINETIDLPGQEIILSSMNVEEILSLVQYLPPSYRTVFNLFVIDGYSHPEIAEKLGITVGSSKSGLAKARGKLQQLIEQHFNYNQNQVNDG